MEWENIVGIGLAKLEENMFSMVIGTERESRVVVVSQDGTSAHEARFYWSTSRAKSHG